MVVLLDVVHSHSCNCVQLEGVKHCRTCWCCASLAMCPTDPHVYHYLCLVSESVFSSSVVHQRTVFILCVVACFEVAPSCPVQNSSWQHDSSRCMHRHGLYQRLTLLTEWNAKAFTNSHSSSSTTMGKTQGILRFPRAHPM